MKLLFLTNNLPLAQPLLDWLGKVEGSDRVTLWDQPLHGSLFQADGPFSGIRFVISYNYRHLIGKDVLDALPGTAINLHISLLPWNRGSSPNLWSFLEDTPKGVTIHQMDSGIDTGPILVQERARFCEEEESFVSSYHKLQTQIKALFRLHWHAIREGKLPPRPQTGQGSCHDSKQTRAAVEQYGIQWDETIASCKMRIRESKGRNLQ